MSLKDLDVPSSKIILDSIRKIPDWPIKGVLFYDITTLLQDPRTYRLLIDLLVYRYMTEKIDIIAGLDARGFIIGSTLAYNLNVGFVPIRKQGKLPYSTVCQKYKLEYGESAIEMHVDAFKPKSRVLLVDDLIATGGTMTAAIDLIRQLDGDIVEAVGVLELNDLPGGEIIRSKGVKLFSVCQASGDVASFKC